MQGEGRKSMTAVQDIVRNLWPLPPPERRRRKWILPPGIFPRPPTLERDGDYLCHLAAATAFSISLIVLVLLALDAALQTAILISGEALAGRALTFMERFMEIMCPIALGLTAVFYLRVRLTIDVRHNPMPFLTNRELMLKQTRSDRIWSMILLLCLLISLMTFPRISGIALFERYHKENSLPLILIWQTVLVTMPALAVVGTISCALNLEKLIRFFPESQNDLERG